MTRFPASPPPLSSQDAYTTWPGGVDPTARVYSSIGGKRSGTKRTKRTKRSMKGRKTRKAHSRKAHRRH